jgi:hypothetical protein
MKLRTLLAGSAVVLVLSVSLAAFGGGGSARADDGQAIYLGMQCVNGTGINCETNETVVQNTYPGGPDCTQQDLTAGLKACGADAGLDGRGTFTGVYGQGGEDGVRAYSPDTGVRATGGDTGVFAVADNFGVQGSSLNIGVSGTGGPVGVYGKGGTNGVEGHGPTGVYGDGATIGVTGRTSNDSGQGVWGDNTGGGNGVYGHTSSSFASGVYGQNDGSGFGVAGRSNAGVGLFGDSANGTAVLANSPSGIALSVQGAMVTNRAGVATIPAGKNRVNQSVPNITSNALVLATVQGPKGKVWVMSATVTPGVHGSITIFLNTNAPSDTRVGWFTLN